MVCILAFIIFSALGIFSAKYKALAKESFGCVFKRLTFKPCDTGFDRRIKAKITGRFMVKYPHFAKIIYMYFEAISWIIIAIMLASFIIASTSVYNLIKHGTCSPSNPAGCALTTTPGSTKIKQTTH